jgi:alpha-glucoside transport system permease protein
MAISATAVGVIWLLVYSPNPTSARVNAVIHGLRRQPVSWLGQTSTVNYAIIIAYVWASTGFAMVVLSAALKGIPTEIIEAAASTARGVEHLPPDHAADAEPADLDRHGLALHQRDQGLRHHLRDDAGGPGTSSRVIAYTMFSETFSGIPAAAPRSP